MIRRGVMSVWKAILLVIGSLVGVAGVTTLGLYISGGFNEKIVEPQDIYFSQEVDGQTFYVDSSDYSAEFNTSSDFFMTIGSTTESVTEKEITLSFEGQGLSSGDYIEDGVIKVPKVVSVGTPFKVELVKMYDSSIYADAVVGGNSILTAKSSNILLDSISARICVDVPVSEFYILPTDETKNQSNTYVVYADTQFSINQIYGPTKSKFLFSDDTKQKLVFYDIQGENLTYSYETQKFSAGENGTGSVTAYTFSNSFYQRQVLAQYGYTYEGMTPAIMESIKTTILADARLAANSKKYKSSTITLQISSATIDSISFIPAGNKYNQQNDRFDAYTNKYLRLTTKSTSVGDATFGVSVTATAGQANTGALLANMGIKLEANSDIKVDGGKIAKVTATSVTIENYDSAKDYTPTENTIYYLLPNTEPQEYDNYYWKISSEKVGTGSLTLNFFTKDQGGAFTNYYTISGFKDGLDAETEKVFNVSFTERETEEPPAWSDQETISMLINYDKDGHIVATSKNLSADIQKTATWKNNVYQEIRYFVFADDKDESKIILPDGKNLTDYFVCSLPGEYAKDYLGNELVVNGTTARAENEKYKLYEIPEGMLIATNSFTGEVKVFIATIQTRADGTPIMDGTKYKIVNTSYVRVVNVESTLSIKNIISENTGVYIEGTKNEDFVVENNKYYIPATSDNIIKLKIALKLNSAADIEKLKRAITAGEAEGGVYFTCVDDSGDETEEYLTLEDFDQDISNSTYEIAIFNGTFAINQQLFEPDFSVLDMGAKIRIKLSYNNGKEIQSEVLKLFVGGEKAKIVDGEDEIEIDAFNIYYPQPTNIDWTSEDDTSVYDGENLKTINVNITSVGQVIEWGTNSFNENAIQQLNNLLIFKLYDQFNREIEQTTAGYQALFVETPGQGEDKILNLNADGNAIASFSSASDQTTTMQVYAYRARNEKIYKYDEGIETSQELKYDKTFTFNVTSEGVERVEYDATTSVNGSSTPSTYAEASNKGAVVIEKYIKFDNSQSNTISLASLIKVWVGESTDPVSNIHFYFDSTYISSLSTNNTTGDSARQSLMKMSEITGDDDKTSKDEGYTEIENWLNKKLKSFRFYYPFAQNTTIRLVAKDSAESLFNITIDLVCIPDVYMRDLIESKNAEWGYADCLVEKDNAISIFADAEYKLDDIIPVYSRSESNAQISWKTILGEKSFDAADQIYWTDQSSLVSLVKDDYKNIYLKIEDTKQFDFANITIFIHKTYFAYKISLRLYINPNIVAVSDDASPVLNANNLFADTTFADTTELSDFYKIYKATDYIKDGENATQLGGTTGWTAANTSTNKYIGIDLENDKFVAESETLELELGETISQNFVLSSGTGSSLRNVYGVKKYGSTIVKSDTNVLCLNFELGYENEVNVVNAETTIYKDKECFVFVSGKTYSLASDFEVYDGQVYGVVDVDLDNPAKKVVAKLTDRLVSLDGNGFKIKKDFSDGTKTLTIVSNVNVVVFEPGDKFVYYNNDVLPNAPKDMKFNYYNDHTDFETLVANYYAENESHSRLGENGYTLLEETYFYQVGQQQASYNICQELYAGQKYKIIHYSKNLDDDFAAGQVFGFYYDSTKIDDLYSVDVSIVEGAQGYVAGLATYEDGVLTINNTESSFTEAYIVLKISITKKNSNFDGVVWFYRIKVIPSFTLGTTNYPYAEDAEYLDVYTRGYYSNGTYSIDFAEILNSTNSQYTENKQRIENVDKYVKVEDVKTEALKGTDVFADSICTDPKVTKLESDTIVTKCELGDNYQFEIMVYVKASDVESNQTKADAKYYSDQNCEKELGTFEEGLAVTQIDGGTNYYLNKTFYIKAQDIKYFVENNTNYYFDDTYTKQAGQTTEKTRVFKYAENKYRFALEFAPTKTFSIKTAYVDGEEILPDDFSDYFEYAFVGETLNISPIDDTTPLTIVVARTLSLCGKALIGGENTYVLRFNQSRDYVANLITTENRFYIKEEDVTCFVDSSTQYFSTADCNGDSTGTLSEDTEVMKDTSGDNYYFEKDVSGTLTTYYVMASAVKYSVASGTAYYLDKTYEHQIGTISEDKQLLKDSENKYYFSELNLTSPTITKNAKSFETTLKADKSTTTFVVDLKERSLNGDILSDISDFKAYVKEGYTDYFTFAFDEINKTISIATKSSISQDKTFTIVVYTDTQIAFYIDLTITGNYEITQLLTEVNAGSEVNFSDILTIAGSHTITFSQPANTKVNGEKIEFAYLTQDTQDTDIEFVVTIDDTYSFNITLHVNANFEVKSRSYNNPTPQYGQNAFNITLDDIKAVAAFSEFNATIGEFKFVAQDGQAITPGTTITITPENAGAIEVHSTTLTLGYFFNGSADPLFTANVTYTYSVDKNVVVATNYPKPTGTELNVEYISTQQYQGSGGVYGEFNDFFNEMADFASANRITATKISAVNEVSDFKFDWLVSITSISNLTIRINGTNYTAQAEGIQGADTNKDKYTIRFTLSNSYAEGSATFLVSVNGVEVEYNVIVVNGNNFSITTNAPNYASVTDKSDIPVTANAETIYAEDLANQEQTLFAENRILKYAFNSSANSGTTYYLKLEKDTTQAVAVAQITADGTTTTKNVDLGQSYQGYTYKGTYTTYVENTKTFSNLIDDAQIYTTAPKLTKRVVATYRNGEEISSDKLTLTTDDVELEEGDFQKIRNTSITATINGSNKSTGISYNIYLDSYYSISGVADSATSYTTIILNADYAAAHVATTLLTNTSLGISLTEAQMKQYGGTFNLLTYGFNDCPINSESGSAYALHNKLKGTPDGEILYSTGLTPRAGEDLNAQGSCGSSTGDITKNYITIAGLSLPNSTKIYDYNIFAQGANNDGNYVMMKLTYSITISTDNTIDISNDILFKVLPSSNVSFKSIFGSSIYSSATNIIEDQRTIATNQTTPYTIQSNGDLRTFYFGNGTQSTNVDINAILALMYNNSASTAGGFDYTFTGNSENWPISGETKYYVKATDVGTDGIVQAGTSYYDTSTITNETEPVGTTTVAQKATATTTSGVYRLLLDGVTLEGKTVAVQNLVLGERTFYIDATNNFGYKIRFFFKVVGETNPIVSEISSDTLTEGDKLVVGAKYQTITPTTTKFGGTEDWAVFNSFTYRKFGEETSFANNLMLQGTYNKARIMFTHSDSKTYYKQWSDSAGSPVDVKTIVDSTEWTELDTENRQTFAETDLANKTITLYVKFDVPTGTASIAPFAAKYTLASNWALAGGTNSEDITQLKNIDTTLQEPAFGTLESNTKSISLTGVKAYAISNSAGAISTATIDNYVSNVTEISVKSIKFYYGDELIGTSSYQETDNTATPPTTTVTTADTAKPLVTSKNVSFYNKKESPNGPFKQGTEYSSELDFEIPTINNGYLFGTGDTISGVTMKITLTDGTNECVVSKLVTINRKETTRLVFDKTEIYDGGAPQVNTTDTSGKVYNDTLEVTLAPGATTTFVITTYDANDPISPSPKTSSAPITLTNPESYSVTRYIGIHTNMTGISKMQTHFKVNLTGDAPADGVTFSYNGGVIYPSTGSETFTQIAQYSNVSGTDAGKPINANALNLHIASRRELSSNKKSVRLFFLFSDKTSSETTRYQAYKDFEVYPEYLDTTDGGSIVLVNDYYKISHGTDNFYVIPLDSWAPNAKRDAQATTGTKIGTGTGDVPAYKFHFEIDTNLGGSAFIDENGTITTAQNIDLQTEKIFVNVYMKVSGTDGNFEDEDGILIETIVLALKPNVSLTSTQSTAGIYAVGNEIVTIPTSYTASKTASASAISTSTTISGISTEIGDPTYAYSIDHTLTKTDFENMFGVYALTGTNYYTNPECTTPATPPTLPSNTLVSKADTGENYTFTSESVAYYVKASDILKNSLTNRNYHVVYTKFGETGTYQYTNNLNGWTFSDTGKWLINVVVTGRNSGTMSQTILHKTIYIYGTASAATEETYIWQTSTAPTLTGFSEISQTDNSLMSTGALAQGIYEKLYLNPTDGTLKAITWYIYNASDTTKKVAVNVPTSSFRVSNIISDVGATIYRYDSKAYTMTPVIYETFNDAANTPRTIKYVSVIDEGSGKTIKYYEITYYFTSSTTNGITDVVQINDDQLDNIKSKIATRLNVDKSNITLYTIKQNGELETCSEITPDSAYQTYSILAVASGTGITTRYYRYTINLYGYTGTSLEITEYYTNADMAYSLSNLHDEIAEEISDTISDSTAKTFWTFTDGDNTLTAITTEDLSETPISTYYVKAADVLENKVAADKNYYYDSACTQEAGTTTAETTVTQVGDKYTIQAPTIFTYYVRLGINKDFVNKNTSYYSDVACENYVGKTAEKIYTTKAEDDYKITIGSTEYYVKPSDVISEEIRYYKLVVTYTKTPA